MFPRNKNRQTTSVRCSCNLKAWDLSTHWKSIQSTDYVNVERMRKDERKGSQEDMQTIVDPARSYGNDTLEGLFDTVSPRGRITYFWTIIYDTYNFEKIS